MGLSQCFTDFRSIQKSRQISEEQKKNYGYNEAPEREETKERRGWTGGRWALDVMGGGDDSSLTEIEKSKLNLKTSSDLEETWLNLSVCK